MLRGLKINRVAEGGPGSGRPKAATPASDYKGKKEKPKNPFSKEFPELGYNQWEKKHGKKKVKEGINVRKWIKAIEKGEDVVVYDKKGKRYNLQGGDNKSVQVTDHWEDAGRRNVHPESTWQTLPLSKVKKIVAEVKT